MDKKNPNQSSSFLSEDLKFKNISQEDFDTKQDLNAKNTEPKVIVKYRDRPKGGGCLGGIGCNAIGCGILLILFACCLGTIFVVISRPAAIWDRVTTYLNTGLNTQVYQPASADYIQENIIGNLKNGQNDIYITEDQLTTIARERLTQFKDLRFDIENEELTMYWALDSSNNPVFGEIRMKTENSTVKIIKIGTPNLTLPEFTNAALNNILLSALNLNNKEGDGNLLSALITDNSNLKINKVEFQKDKLYLDVNISINLFQ